MAYLQPCQVRLSSESPIAYSVTPASPAPARLGESPLWSIEEQALYYVDIAAHQVWRLHPASGDLRHWSLDGEPGCIALIEGGVLAVAQRQGLFRLDLDSGRLSLLAQPPYDPARQRFNDGKPDVKGRLWVGGIDDSRAPDAALYRYESAQFTEMAAGITTSNGLAWSPDQTLLYWADTKAHEIYRLSFDADTGTLGERQTWVRFAPREPGQALEAYGGRPDGAAVDVEGCYWVAMYEGQRLLRLSPEGQVLREIKLPVRCPTMPCFGGPDLRTLYITSAREGRPADELAAQAWAGCVLQVRVEVAGLPAHRLKL